MVADSYPMRSGTRVVSGWLHTNPAGKPVVSCSESIAIDPSFSVSFLIGDLERDFELSPLSSMDACLLCTNGSPLIYTEPRLAVG